MSIRKKSSLALAIIAVAIITLADAFTKSDLNLNSQKPEEVLSQSTQESPLPQVHDAATVTVTKVIDGDTIEIEGGQKLRYIGMDTPETVHPKRGIECYGKEASSKNKELVEGKTVRLEKDVSETDKYERLLRYVYVDDVFVNEYMVREGFAYASSYPPDVKYQEKLRAAQKEAQNLKKGLWGSCTSG
ncbi:MAG: thermonuclease family protein [Candidatus Curtissbacteria bacterium]|nr:thermonuclease family protein [Candidatus Curtissbacteria bacterium]